MINAVIIDDEPIARKLLHVLLGEYCQGFVQVAGEASNAIEGLKLINKHSPDLIFLDVEMPMGTGFDLLELNTDRRIYVVFTTAYAQHASHALAQHAAAYLLKPVTPDKLKAAVLTVKDLICRRQALEESKQVCIRLSSLRGSRQVPVSDIVYIEAEGRYSRIFLVGGPSHLESRNLGELEAELDGNFIRIHRSLLVNRHHITSLNKNQDRIGLSNKTELPVSRRKRAEVLSILRKTE